MTGKTPYQIETRQPNAMWMTAVFGDFATTGKIKSTLPKGAVVLGCTYVINTAFNQASTATISIGTNGPNTCTNIAAATTVAAATTTRVATATVTTMTADTDVYLKVSGTGTAGTTGSATVVLEYVVDPTLYQ